nr:unknown [Medicago truncatula]
MENQFRLDLTEIMIFGFYFYILWVMISSIVCFCIVRNISASSVISLIKLQQSHVNNTKFVDMKKVIFVKNPQEISDLR